MQYPGYSHTSPLLTSLHWLSVAVTIRHEPLTLIYAAANRPRLQAIIQPVEVSRLTSSSFTWANNACLGLRAHRAALRKSAVTPGNVSFT